MRECVCAPPHVQRYLSKISGPLLDRIDLHIEVTPVSFDELNKRADGEPSAAVRARVVEGRRVQAERFAEVPEVYCNAQMGTRMVRRYCKIEQEGQQLMKMAIHRLGLSARAYDRILRDCLKIGFWAAHGSFRPSDARFFGPYFQYAPQKSCIAGPKIPRARLQTQILNSLLKFLAR